MSEYFQNWSSKRVKNVLHFLEYRALMEIVCYVEEWIGIWDPMPTIATSVIHSVAKNTIINACQSCWDLSVPLITKCKNNLYIIRSFNVDVYTTKMCSAARPK